MAKLISKASNSSNYSSNDLEAKSERFKAISSKKSGIMKFLVKIFEELHVDIQNKSDENLKNIENSLWKEYLYELKNIRIGNVNSNPALKESNLLKIGIIQDANPSSTVVMGQQGKGENENTSRNTLFNSDFNSSIRSIPSEADNIYEKRIVLAKIEILFLSFLNSEDIKSLLDSIAKVTQEAIGIEIHATRIFNIIINYRDWVSNNIKNNPISIRQINEEDKMIEEFIINLISQYDKSSGIRFFEIFKKVTEENSDLYMLMSSLNNLGTNIDVLKKSGIIPGNHESQN